MAKILVSDLYGTLVPTIIEEMEYFYSAGQKMRTRDEVWADSKYCEELKDRVFFHLANYLEQYLSDENYLYLVTASDSHDGSGFLFDDVIRRFCRYTEKYKDQVFVFLSGVLGCDWEEDDLKSVAHVEENDGVIFADNGEGTRAILLNDKADVFNFILKNHDLCTNQLVAIGDSIYDLPMLFRCIELGGKSSIIDQNLYREYKSSQQILNETARRNSDLMIGYDKLSTEHRLLYGSLHQQLFRAEWDKLYKEMLDGELDLDMLEKKQWVYRMLCTYNDFSRIGHWPKVEINEGVIDSFDVYPTFVDYSNKKLVYKK